MRKINITDKQKEQYKKFLEKMDKIKSCNCDLMNPCRKCIKIITGKEYLTLLNFNNNK